MLVVTCIGIGTQTNLDVTSCATETDISMNGLTKMEEVQKQYEEIYVIRERLAVDTCRILNREALEKDNKLLKFYTGHRYTYIDFSSTVLYLYRNL